VCEAGELVGLALARCERFRAQGSGQGTLMVTMVKSGVMMCGSVVRRRAMEDGRKMGSHWVDMGGGSWSWTLAWGRWVGFPGGVGE